MTTFTGKGIDALRWVTVRAQLRLEKVGMTSSGGALRPRLAKELGLKPSDSHDKYIEAVTAKLQEAKAALQPGDIKL